MYLYPHRLSAGITSDQVELASLPYSNPNHLNRLNHSKGFDKKKKTKRSSKDAGNPNNLSKEELSRGRSKGGSRHNRSKDQTLHKNINNKYFSSPSPIKRNPKVRGRNTSKKTSSRAQGRRERNDFNYFNSSESEGSDNTSLSTRDISYTQRQMDALESFHDPRLTTGVTTRSARNDPQNKASSNRRGSHRDYSRNSRARGLRTPKVSELMREYGGDHVYSHSQSLGARHDRGYDLYDINTRMMSSSENRLKNLKIDSARELSNYGPGISGAGSDRFGMNQINAKDAGRTSRVGRHGREVHHREKYHTDRILKRTQTQTQRPSWR